LGSNFRAAYIDDLICKSKIGVDEQSSHKMVSIHFKRQNSARLAPAVGAIKPKKKNNLTDNEQNNVVIILIESPMRVVLLIFIALHWQFGDGLASRCFQLPGSTMCVPIREERSVTSVCDVERTGAAALGKRQ
jgi:hypothetical protein